MGYIDKSLLKASKEGDKLCTEDGVTVKAKYLGYKQVKNEKYNKMQTIFTFKKQDGSEKIIKTTQRKLLGKFATIEPGSIVEVTTVTIDKVPDYTIEVVSRPKMAQQVVEEEEVIEDAVETTEDDDEAEEEGAVDELEAKW